MNIDRLLKPESVAVVGASEKEGFGGDTCRNILKYTRNIDSVYFVNPKRESVLGRPCYASLSAVPADIDLVIICTPQKAVAGIIAEAGKKGCGGAVVFASGYSETGSEGRARQEELVRLCNEQGIAMMGPNCAGFANYWGDVFSFAFLSEDRERAGNIGMISQSGQVCLSALDKPDLAFSYIISSGNSAQISTEQYLEFLAGDENTEVIAAYIEGVREPARFVDALRLAARNKKPVIILKTGRSQKSVALASSHTGSIAGGDAAFDAVMHKYGVLRVDDLQELLGTAHMFSVLRQFPESFKWACMNVSGGEAGICADMGHLCGLEYAEIGPRTREALKGIVPAYCTPDNPLDMTATLAYVPELFARALAILMDDEAVGGVIIGYTIPHSIIDQSVPCMIKGIEEAARQGMKKPLLWLPFVEHTKDQTCAGGLRKLNVPVLSSGMSGMRSLKLLEKFCSFDRVALVVNDGIALPSAVRPEGREVLSEQESMELFHACGVQGVLPAKVAVTEEEVVRFAEDTGFPVAIKVNSRQIPHKSDAGCVKLNISCAAAARAAYREIMENAAHHCPDAVIDGVTVNPMLKKGVEIIIGMNNDPQFGPIMMVGLGGVFVELFKDVALRPVPLGMGDARDMLLSLKGFSLLSGYRGAAPCDVDALAGLLCRLSLFAEANRDTIREFDLNPVFVYGQGQGVAVADALVTKYA